MSNKLERQQQRIKFLNLFVQKMIFERLKQTDLEGEKQIENLLAQDEPFIQLNSKLNEPQLPELPPLPKTADQIIKSLRPQTPLKKLPQQNIGKTLLPKRIIPNLNRLPPGGVIELPQAQKRSLIKPQASQLASMPIPQKTTSSVSGEAVNLGKLAQLLKDPTVMNIECPGPDKNVLVNKGGVIETTSLRLKPDEINTIMQDISDKTRIPLISGMFKALHNNMVITAVISDFVGTRFIVQKRLPGIKTPY